METQSDFLISSPEKIYSKLYILDKHKNLLTVTFDNGANNFVATILELNKKQNTFVCDICDEAMIDKVLRSPKIFFRTEHLGAIVAFNTDKIAITQFDGGNAFSVPIPTSMRWQEQREYYRMRVPMASTSRCQLVLDGQENPIELKLYDISVRGFAVVNPSEEISELLQEGAEYPKGKLIFDNKEEVPVSFEIRSKFVLNANNLNRMEKIGCKVTNITPAFETTVHSYMLEIEREMLRKRADNLSYANY